MNSAGRLMATSTVTRRMPSRMSSGVIVSPRPTCTLKASSGTAPARPPRFQMPVRKLEIIPFIVTQVPATLGSNTIALAARRIDSSSMIIVRRTLM